jgi:hypothetical protein
MAAGVSHKVLQYHHDPHGVIADIRAWFVHN